jgi:SNF2 family DNA or RNA helicase
MSRNLEEALACIREARDNPNLPVPTSWNRQYSLQPYQRVGVSHLLVKKRFVLGDDCGTGKTVAMLYSWAVLREKRPLRLMVVTTKSATYQWGSEIDKFLHKIPYTIIPSTNKRGTQATKQDRIEAYQQWFKQGEESAIILNWVQLANDWEWLKETISIWGDHTYLCLDEIQKIKNPESVMAGVVKELQGMVQRVQGLTATIVKNKAHDAFNIINQVVPGLMTQAYFEHSFCNFSNRDIYIKGRKRNIKEVASYKELDKFATEIAPFYLSRTDDELGLERPEIVQVTRKAKFTPEQREIYNNAELGLYIDPDKQSEDSIAASIIHAQLAANNPEVFLDKTSIELCRSHPKYEKMFKSNPKIELVKDLLEAELEGEQVVIYCPLKTTVNQLMIAFSNYDPVRITGDESDEDREKAKVKFMTKKTKLIFITDAGGEALNLQVAKHLIFYSRPWAPGTYTQVVGRIRRFGLEASHVMLWHPTIEDSVDEFVDSVLQDKMGPFEKIVGGDKKMLDKSNTIPLEIAKRLRRARIRRNSN